MTNILNLLEEDSKHRYIGVTEDLFTLHDLSPESSWDYSLPTLVSTSDYSKIKIERNNDQFKKSFYNNIPYLNTIDLSNMLIAGGSIRSVLLNSRINDVDIFLYGLKTPTEAKSRIEKFILDLHIHLSKLKNGHYVKSKLDELNAKMEGVKTKSETNTMMREFNEKHKDKYDPKINDNISIFSNGNTVTLFVNNIKMQIVLRLYNSVSEILHGFDLGSSAVGFDGSNVYFTSLSKFCFENMVNIIDCTRRSTTYENRLIKYFNVGFNIIVPNLDIKKLKCNYHKYNLMEVCEMPYLVFSYSEINGKSIKVNDFHKHNGNDVVTDYDFYGNLYNDQSGNEGPLKYMLWRYNLTELINGKNRFVIKIDLNDELSVIESKNLDKNSWTLDFSKQFIDLGFVEWCYNDMLKKLSSDKIPLALLKKYFNIDSVNNIVSNIYLKELGIVELNARLSNLVNDQKTKIRNDLINLKINHTLNWIVENPTTQLTSSVNPIIADPKLWYGDFYLNTTDLMLSLSDNIVISSVTQHKQHKKTKVIVQKSESFSDTDSEDEADKPNNHTESEDEEPEPSNNTESEDETNKSNDHTESENDNNVTKLTNSVDSTSLTNSNDCNNSLESVKSSATTKSTESIESTKSVDLVEHTQTTHSNKKKNEFIRIMVFDDGTMEEVGSLYCDTSLKAAYKAINIIVKEYELDNDTEVQFGIKDVSTDDTIWYTGSVQTLDNPITLNQNGKNITYKYKSTVKICDVPDCLKQKKGKKRQNK